MARHQLIDAILSPEVEWEERDLLPLETLLGRLWANVDKSPLLGLGADGSTPLSITLRDARVWPWAVTLMPSASDVNGDEPARGHGTTVEIEGEFPLYSHLYDNLGREMVLTNFTVTLGEPDAEYSGVGNERVEFEFGYDHWPRFRGPSPDAAFETLYAAYRTERVAKEKRLADEMRRFEEWRREYDMGMDV